MAAKSLSAPRPRATSDGIIVVACGIARERGWAAVTIRAIADELGYTSPIIYEHFKNKDEAIAAAARQGFGELEIALGVAEGQPGSDERIVALANAYIDFAHRHPELYRVMHGMDGAVTNGATIAEGAERVCALASGELVQWAEASGVSMPDPLAATEVLWCLLHGFATLALAGRLQRETPTQAEPAVRTMLAGWRTAHS